MTTYAVSSASLARKMRFSRLTMWFGLVVLLLVFAIGLSMEQGPSRRLVTWVASLLTAALVLFACYAAAVLGAANYVKTLTVELEGDRVIRRREDDPIATVVFSQISSLKEDSRGLQIESDSDVIWIPNEISGFAEIRSQLERVRPIENIANSSILPFVSPVLLIVCWILLFASQKREVVLISAGGIVVFQAWETSWIVRRLRKGRSFLALSAAFAALGSWPCGWFIKRSLSGSS